MVFEKFCITTRTKKAWRNAPCLFSFCLFGVPSHRGTQRACLRVLRAEGQVQCAIFSQRGLEFLAGQRPHFRRQMGQSPTEYRTKARNGG